MENKRKGGEYSSVNPNYGTPTYNPHKFSNSNKVNFKDLGFWKEKPEEYNISKDYVNPWKEKNRKFQLFPQNKDELTNNEKRMLYIMFILSVILLVSVLLTRNIPYLSNTLLLISGFLLVFSFNNLPSKIYAIILICLALFTLILLFIINNVELDGTMLVIYLIAELSKWVFVPFGIGLTLINGLMV